MQNYQLVLASTSPYRQQLLNKLAVSFITASPQFDETPLEHETPIELVSRLAKGKAESCHVEETALIIGSDQVCVIDGRIIGKPLTEQKAIEQLTQQSGQSIQFFTGLAVHNNLTKQTEVKVDTFTVHFRSLSQQQMKVTWLKSNHYTVLAASRVKVWVSRYSSDSKAKIQTPWSDYH